MSLIVHTVTSASTSINYKYLGSTHLFGLEITGTYTFSIDDLELIEDGTLLEHDDAFKALRRTYTNKILRAKIGADIFRAGIVKSISRPEQNSLNSNEVTITITEHKQISDDGELSDLTSKIPSPQKLESFSETFDFQRSGSEVSYTRNISLKYAEDISDQFLNNAYIFIKGIYLNSRPEFGYQFDGLSEKLRFNNRLRPRITENYDLINKSVTFSENMTLSEKSSNSRYSKAITYSIRNTSDGFLEKEYNIEIVGLRDPVSAHSKDGAKAVIAELISDETAQFGDPILIDKTVGNDSGRILIRMLFSTDRSKNQISTFTYSVSRSTNQSYLDYKVDMERARNNQNVIGAYNELVTDWKNDLDTPKAKIEVLFPDANILNIYEKARDTSFTPHIPSIRESITYTTDPSYNNTDPSILKSNVSISENQSVERIFEFVVPKDKERIQRLFPEEEGTLGERSVSVELIKRKGSDDETSEEEAFVVAEAFKPTAEHWITQKSSSLNPTNGVTNVSITYNYFNGSVTYVDSDSTT